MSDPAAIRRDLKIKTGAAKRCADTDTSINVARRGHDLTFHRLLKEHNSYRDEATQNELKANKLVADGADEWDVKNAVR
jgi:tubulin-specific chaperone A